MEAEVNRPDKEFGIIVRTNAADASKEEALAAGKEAIADKLTGNVIKEIYVPKKIINIVMK